MAASVCWPAEVAANLEGHPRFHYGTDIGADRSGSKYAVQLTATTLSRLPGTLWAAYNGVAELMDHRAQPSDRRLESAWFGDGYSAKVRAYRAACEWLKAGPNN